MNIGLYNGFHGIVSSFGLELGKCIFELTLMGCAYVLSRCNTAEAKHRFIYGSLGYFVLKGISLYMKFIDITIDNAISTIDLTNLGG